MHIKAKMPGIIKEIKIKEGDQIKTGDLLLVMEVLKMKVNIEAPQAGTVKSVNVSANERVKTEQILIDIE